ncbi:hypothetical protein BDW66DRAFT_169411 [Aspergillus desertorum]
MSAPSRRSHGGCWTCKAGRRKCDRARPTCRVCSERGILCEGYGMRLRWGTGIASRGHFTGAEAPVRTSILPRAPGRRRDRDRDRRRQQEGREAQAQVHVGPTPAPLCVSCPGHATDDARLFQEFLASGINILHSTSVHDEQTLLKPRLPTLCQQSEALYRICVALQASLSREPTARFFEYLDIGLNKFRAELAKSEPHLEDGTLTAGLLLCTVGVMHGIPWTMHLRGMYGILRANGVQGPHSQQEATAFRAHLFEVMGIMDLPTLTVGRQHEHLGFWRQYCCERDFQGESEAEIGVVTGLPKSLVTIFAFIGEGTTEIHFWDWPGAQDPEATADPAIQRGIRPPSTGIIVSRLLSSVDAVCRASLDPECWDTLIINAISYPVCVAGLQGDILERDPTLKEFIRNTLQFTAEGPYWNRQYRLLLDLLEEYWTYLTGTMHIDQLARARGIELGLF